MQVWFSDVDERRPVGAPQDSLTFLLLKTAKRALVALEAELMDLDLTARQYLLLTLAATGKELSQQDLAMKLDLDPTIVVKVIDQLEQRELLERARAVDDRRRHQLTLTTEGKRVLREARMREQKVERSFPDSIALRDLLRAALGY
jgi:DNA-binding MarR family transcriptional regulator